MKPRVDNLLFLDTIYIEALDSVKGVDVGNAAR